MTLAADLDKLRQFKKITVYKIRGKKATKNAVVLYKLRLWSRIIHEKANS